MNRPMSEFPVTELEDGFHAVLLRGWEEYLYDTTIRRMGRPLRPEHPDAWILTTTAEDAAMLAKLAQRNFYPEDVMQTRDRFVTTKRQPTFAAAMRLVPDDVAIYFSGTHLVDDHARIQKLHPAPPRVSERITWSAGGYRVASGHGYFSETIGTAPRTFAKALDRARENLLAAVGPGFDGTLDHLNASPILAAMLPCLTRPAAEAVAHWLGRLGTGELDRLMIPPRGLNTDLPVHSLSFESKGVNLHASFMLNMGDIRVTEMCIEGLSMPDTIGTALDAEARAGRLMLSQIVDLPGAERVPVLSMTRGNSTWSAVLDPVSVPIDPPVSEIPFDGDEEMARIEGLGNEISTQAAVVLQPLGRERASFAIYCTEDRNSGMDFDISPWMPGGATLALWLRERRFVVEGHRQQPLSGFLKDLP